MEQQNLESAKKVLRKSTVLLCKNLDPENVLLAMKTKEELTGNDVEMINAKPTRQQKVDQMLEILQRKPLSAYIAFMEILKDERQDLYKQVKEKEIECGYVSAGAGASTISTVVTETVTGTASASGTSPASQAIEDKKKIIKIMEKVLPDVRKVLAIDTSLLNKLVAEEVIASAQSETIQAINVSNEKVDYLFKVVKKKPTKAFFSFMEVLKEEDEVIFDLIKEKQTQQGLVERK